jgi:hypothetical protein
VLGFTPTLGQSGVATDEVYHMPIATTLTIILSSNKTFVFHHLFNEDGQSLIELLKGDKLDQMLLKFVPLFSPSILNFIISLKHRSNNSSSIDCILR